jgi:hypothetical protein
MYVVQHCLICSPSDSTVSEDAGIEPDFDIDSPSPQVSSISFIQLVHKKRLVKHINSLFSLAQHLVGLRLASSWSFFCNFLFAALIC